MFKVWFLINGNAACLVKEYKTKGNAVKYAKKVLPEGTEFEVAQECPYEVK